MIDWYYQGQPAPNQRTATMNTTTTTLAEAISLVTRHTLAVLGQMNKDNRTYTTQQQIDEINALVSEATASVITKYALDNNLI